MSIFGSIMRGLLIRAVVPIIGIAGIAAYKSGKLDGVDIPYLSSTANHYEMQARIVSVENACRLRYRANGKLRQTEALPCDRAAQMLQEPQFVGYAMHKSKRVEYSYYAPNGRSTLVGTLPRIRDKSGRPYRRNDVITIRINAKDATKSEVI